MKNPITWIIAAMLLISCKKQAESSKNPGGGPATAITAYTIFSGQHYADKNPYRQVAISGLKFIVRFDSSAIYTTASPSNQDDINKLYGFSDNNANHHQYSARIGWRWSDNALRLFAYVYNNGIVSSKELGAVAIGTEINCAIGVSGGSYTFSVNGLTVAMPREATTPVASGYQLYPYFGGDEAAPHDIRIWIRELAGND